jgi:hypothetical protein
MHKKNKKSIIFFFTECNEMMFKRDLDKDGIKGNIPSIPYKLFYVRKTINTLIGESIKHAVNNPILGCHLGKWSFDRSTRNLGFYERQQFKIWSDWSAKIKVLNNALKKDFDEHDLETEMI